MRRFVMHVVGDRLSQASLALIVLSTYAATTLADPPTCTTHFFDWYIVNEKTSLEQRQKHWTYRIDWGVWGIVPSEIGNSVHYYQVQCQKIRDAGFDGIHYEWHGNNPKPQFIEALRRTRVPMAMFYDMQIRFHKRPNFIHPSPEFATEAASDVCSFYQAVPRELWLRDRNGKLPIIVYGYAFDQSVKSPKQWDHFYRTLIAEIQSKLNESIVLHWTNTRTAQQTYGFQHFPEIQSYIFNEAQRQTQVNAHSVTFVVHYDDLGVSFMRGGTRPRRWIRNDIRYLQEALWLAKHTDPDLVFNYGWNELYEGEHLLPDTRWGTWRYEVASAMVKDIKKHAKTDLPRALIVVDDFLPDMYEAPPERARLLNDEMQMVADLRSFLPQAAVVTPGSVEDFSVYEIVVCLNTTKNPKEEQAIAVCDKRVVYANADLSLDTPMTRVFTDSPRRPSASSSLPHFPNEYVIATRDIDVDIARFPVLQYRCRNSKESLFHIRCFGSDEKGEEVRAWHESSPTDDRQSQGGWQEAEVNIAHIAKEAAGRPLPKLTRIELILDDMDKDGDFKLDVDFLRFTDGRGEVGWEDDFGDTRSWKVHSSFDNSPNAQSRYSFVIVKEDGSTIGTMAMKATVSSRTADIPLQIIDPTDGVRVLCEAPEGETTIPLILSRGKRFFINTYCPSDETWRTLMSTLLEHPLNRGVMFHSFSYDVRQDGLTRRTDSAWTVIGEEELPIDRVRLVAPPELDEPMPFTLPKSSQPLSPRVIRGSRKEIPWPNPGSDPPTITLFPGEVVDLVKR